MSNGSLNTILSSPAWALTYLGYHVSFIEAATGTNRDVYGHSSGIEEWVPARENT